MLGHLSEAALLEVLEGASSPDARAHVEACARCRGRVEEAREALALVAGGADVPEPSPLYWESMRREVARRSAEPRRAWLPFLLPIAAAAALVMAVPASRRLSPVGPAPSPSVSAALPAWSALPADEDDQDLAVLAAVARSQPDAALAAFDNTSSANEELFSMSEEEGKALVEALRASGQGRDL
jgi:hypothetical protein